MELDYLLYWHYIIQILRGTYFVYAIYSVTFLQLTNLTLVNKFLKTIIVFLFEKNSKQSLAVNFYSLEK